MSIVRIIVSCVIPLFALGLVSGAVQQKLSAQRSVFEEPQAQVVAGQLVSQMLQQTAAGNLEAAQDRAMELARMHPWDPGPQYNIACLSAVRGKKQLALKFLREALRLGFRNADHMEKDPDLQTLSDDPEFKRLVEAARQPFELPRDHPDRNKEPGVIQDGVALVSSRNTRWNRVKGVLDISFAPLAADARDNAGDATAGNSDAEVKVRKWFQDGTAAGHLGDLYDNRDRDHSNLNLSKFPQLIRVEYDDEAKKVRTDWGVQIYQMFDRPVLGNSSTAQVGTRGWRSNPRIFLFNEPQTRLVYNQYVSNHLYVYPEHNDYDPQHGDVFPANIPFCVISQGSSGSDRPFLEALALTMAAFRPEVKQLLVKNGLLMPTVQYIFRRSNRNVQSDDDYLAPGAHPIVFASKQLDPVRMVEMAHDMHFDNLPPMVQLKVEEEDQGVPGKDFFFPPPGQKLFDTPVAIARVYRTIFSSRRMVIDASDSRDLHRKQLSFRWVVLQGDPQLVSIRPLTERGEKAEIIFQWHPRIPIPDNPSILSSRVDIGVFAFNGTYYSAPAFVSSFTLSNEKREYNDQGQILSIDYADPAVSKNYVDPYIEIPKRWRDDYQYSDEGQLLGWKRTMTDGGVHEFHYDGTLVVSRDPMGRPAESRIVRYDIVPADNMPGSLRMAETDRVLTWKYQSDKDRLGTPIPKQ